MTSRSLAAMLALALLVACGGDGQEAPRGSDEEATAREQPVSIQLLLFGDAVETAGYARMIEAFSQAHANIGVTMTPVAKQDDLLAKLTTQFAAGAPPDVFLINFRKYGQFAAEGALEPVQPYLDASEVLSEDEFYEPPLDAFRFDGQQLTCMPQNMSSLQVYYNVDLFEAAGVELPDDSWSWEEFVDAGKALTKDGVYGIGVEPKIIRVAPFVWSNGGDVVDDRDNPGRLTLLEGPAREALDFFLDLSLQHDVVPPDREEQAEDAEARFLRGGLGMLLDSRKAVPTLRTIEGFRWDVGSLPVPEGGERATILHADAYCMSKGGNTDAAWKFIEFAMSEEGQTIVAESGRTVPSRKDVSRSPAFLDPEAQPENSEVFLEAAEYMRATPHVANWSRVEKEADQILEEIFYGRIPREEGMQQLVARTAALFGPGG